MFNRKLKKKLKQANSELELWKNIANWSIVEFFNMKPVTMDTENIVSIRYGESVNMFRNYESIDIVEYKFLSGLTFKLQIQSECKCSCECCCKKKKKKNDKVKHIKLIDIYEHVEDDNPDFCTDRRYP